MAILPFCLLFDCGCPFTLVIVLILLSFLPAYWHENGCPSFLLTILVFKDKRKKETVAVLVVGVYERCLSLELSYFLSEFFVLFSLSYFFFLVLFLVFVYNHVFTHRLM